MLPNFLLIGAPKSGTTSLWRYLKAHPQVFMPSPKEPHFFVEEMSWSRGIDWYESLFAMGEKAVAVGEASTGYAKYPYYSGVPARISTILPDVKFLYLMRDPVERIRSHYDQLIANGADLASLEEALKDPRFFAYSSYAMQIDQYLEYFSLDRFLLMTTEDLRFRRSETMARIYEFLGVPSLPDTSPLDQTFHRTSQKLMPRSSITRLRRHGSYRTISRLLSSRAKVWIDQRTRLIRGPIRQEIVTPDVRRQITQRMRVDVGTLREYMPDGFDGWGIA